MALLIDGYNLLHATGIIGQGRGPGGFERSRMALLDFVADSLPAKTLASTTVVFDAAGAPPGLPQTLEHRGITVRFARRHESADALIEELIEADNEPKRLIVVSSDHRLHRAARRRKAKAIDSDAWYADVLRERRRRHSPPSELPAKPQEPPDDTHVAYWLALFADDELDQQATDTQIFPPGYGDDLDASS